MCATAESDKLETDKLQTYRDQIFYHRIQGEHLNVVDLVEEMKNAGLTPDLNIYNNLIV